MDETLDPTQAAPAPVAAATPASSRPQLGYGHQSEANINVVNQWLRSSPGYYELLAKWGQDPRNVHLNGAQKSEMLHYAQSQGVVVDEGDMEIDPAGNLNPKGHKLRNTLIVAGIAAATIATMGAAGVFAGAGGAAGGAASGAGTAAGLGGVEAGVTSGLGAAALPGAMATLPAAVGGTAALGGAAALGGVEAGVTSGLGSAALPGAMATLPATAGTTAAVGGGLAGAAGELGPSTAANMGATTAAANGVPSGIAASGGGSTLGMIGSMAKKGLSAADLLRRAGSTVGDMADAAGNNRLNQEQLDLAANGQNIAAQNNGENQLNARAKLEADQRNQAQKDVYRASFFANRKPGPYNAAGITPTSQAYTDSLSALEKQGLARLQASPQYDTTVMPKLAPYTPYVPSKTANAQPSSGETIGKWLGPGMTIGGMALDWMRGR